ncbi:MAG: DUF3006 domain-containing protein [Desulfitobacteriaceae bacterium]
MKGIIDRLEGNMAVVEIDGRLLDIPRDQLPDKVKEGDVIVGEKGAYLIDEQETKRRRKEIEKLTKNLWT